MSIYFALGADGRLYNLCDCGDFEAAEESADDVIPDEAIASQMGIPFAQKAVWIFDEHTAVEWLNVLLKGVTMNTKIKLSDFEVTDEDRAYFRVNDLHDVKVVRGDEGLTIDVYPNDPTEQEVYLGDPIASLHACDNDWKAQ